VKLCTACIFTVNFSTPAAQRISQVKWLTPVKPGKNACPASALFKCYLIRSDATDAAAADHKATPPPPMINARRAAAAAGHKTTQRRRRPPVRRRTALTQAMKGANYHQGGFCRISPSYQRSMKVVFVKISLNNLSFRSKWRHHYIYFRFLVTGL